MVIRHQKRVNILQEMVGIHQEKSDDFPTVSCENSQTNVIIHQETVGFHQEMVGIYQEIAGIRQEMAGIDQEKSGDFRPEYCFHVPTFFRCFPAGTGPYFLTWVF